MFYKMLRYISTAFLVYFAMVGAGHTFFAGGDLSFPIRIVIYFVFCIGPFMVLFFGIGASDVDILRKSRLSDSEKEQNSRDTILN